MNAVKNTDEVVGLPNTVRELTPTELEEVSGGFTFSGTVFNGNTNSFNGFQNVGIITP